MNKGEDIILYGTMTHSLNTNNGILNKDNLQFAKNTLLFDTIRNNTELIKVKQGYPQNDISDVELSLDAVMISRKRYEEFLKLEELLKASLNLSQKEEDKIKKYLNFPKLKV